MWLVPLEWPHGHLGITDFRRPVRTSRSFRCVAHVAHLYAYIYKCMYVCLYVWIYEYASTCKHRGTHVYTQRCLEMRRSSRNMCNSCNLKIGRVPWNRRKCQVCVCVCVWGFGCVNVFVCGCVCVCASATNVLLVTIVCITYTTCPSYERISVVS